MQKYRIGQAVRCKPDYNDEQFLGHVVDARLSQGEWFYDVVKDGRDGVPVGVWEHELADPLRAV